MAIAIDKQALLELVRAELTAALKVMVDAAQAAKEAATHEDAKPENDKDTRGIEAGYLAGAQAARAEEIQRALAGLASFVPRKFSAKDMIAASAFVELADEEGAKSHVFLVTVGGGLKIKHGKLLIQVVTPEAPLGQALLGKAVGDAIELRIGGRVRALDVIAVS